mmetsp:Transcript_8343/g.12437  ORF Transcript_8343/g.12437 Transcript_8343/m.12437 type:complete len:175 (-) Transcript_8343:199-723(-)
MKHTSHPNAVQNEKGEWVIPSSKRPDGTWRKEIVLKEGYVPQDEVRTFQTRASKLSIKSVPGMPPAQLNSKVVVEESKKKEEKLSKAEISITSNSTSKSADVEASSVDLSALKISDSETSAETKNKKVKALRKKLKEISELSLKNINELSEEQLVKLNRKSDIENELNALMLEI